MQTNQFETRLRVMLALFIVAFGGLWVRLFYIQVVQGENLRIVAEANRTSLLFERAPRGLILDRNSQVLADNRPSFLVLVTPLELKKEVLNDVVLRLSKVLNLSEEEVKRKLQPAIKHRSLVRLIDRASRNTAFALAEQRPNLPGVSVVTEMQRHYPNGQLAAHLLGYLGQVNPDEFQELRNEGFQPEWLIGKTGLERIYDRYLRGEHGGMRIEVDASGRSVKILDRKEPTAGYQIVTTLDSRIQKVAEDALMELALPGAVVAMDPNSGDILALASAPSFDPNLFLYTRGELESGENPTDLLTRADLPLFNRTIQGAFPPGSIFKIVSSAAALEAKKMRPEDSVFCPGFYNLGGQGGRKFLCWKHSGHGPTRFDDALVNSCDTFFYVLGLKTGPDAIEEMGRRFGLGAATGVGLSSERSGLMPGRGMFKGGKRRWFDGDTLNTVIGQGTMLMTPMQAAQMISIVANRGKVYQPHFVKEIRTPDGSVYEQFSSKLLRDFTLAPQTWEFLDRALIRTVNEGTGQASKVPGIPVGGKTGTAQNPHGKDHAWFVAYAPVGDPKIAVSVLVMHGEHGSTAAAPVAQRIIRAALLGDTTTQAHNTPMAAPPAAMSGD